MTVRLVTEWVTEQWFHQHHEEPTGTATVTEVIVPQTEIQAVIAEAEVLCAAAAITEEVFA